MRISTHTKTTHTLTLDDDIELEPEYMPLEGYGYDEPLIERIGENTIVVGYLVQDEDGGSFNPMENHDCQGHIYTRGNNRVITDDDREVSRALGIDSYGSPDIDREFPFERHLGWDREVHNTVTLRDLGAAVIFNELEAGLYDESPRFAEWMEDQGWVIPEAGISQAFQDLAIDLFRDLVDENGYFWDEVDRAATDLYSEYWQQIAGPYVVPISYHSERGSTSISVTDWDGDFEYLPDGVWVADDGAIEGIDGGFPAGIGYRFIEGGSPVWHHPAHGIQPTKEQVQAGYHVVLDDGVSVAIFDLYTPFYPIIKDYIFESYGHRPCDVAEAARDYAASVLSQYETWCNGEVFGVVTQVFERQADGAWESQGDDSCWGFIGHGHAKVSLEHDYFRPLVDSVRKRLEVAPA